MKNFSPEPTPHKSACDALISSRQICLRSRPPTPRPTHFESAVSSNMR